MTRAEAFDKAWKLGLKGDFSLVDEIYHPEYTAFDNTSGVEVNLEADKIAVSTIREMIIFGPRKILFEDENFLEIQTYNRFKDSDIFNSVITSITYKDGKIITQKSVGEELDSDPSEGQDWNWEDFD